MNEKRWTWQKRISPDGFVPVFAPVEDADGNVFMPRVASIKCLMYSEYAPDNFEIARRIVASVNYCLDMSIEELEQHERNVGNKASSW